MSKVQGSDILREWRESAPYWARHSATIRKMFAPVTLALIEEAAIVPGMLVLDVAGGPGEPSLTLADKVGPTGSVTCTDAVGEMVAAARAEAGRRLITNIEFRQCSADSLPFPDNSFDVVVSRLGAMFFPEPLTALKEMLRVTKSGGVVSLAVWNKSELNPFAHLVTDVVSRYVETPAADADAPGAFRFAEPGKLPRVLVDAGWIDVRERNFSFHIEAPISPAQFWTMRSETSESLRAKLATLTAERVASVAEEVRQKVGIFFPNNEMKFPAQMILVTGRKA